MAKRERIPQLSKSRFLAGFQCPLRLYYECYHRELIPEIGVAQQALFDVGHRVGRLAQSRYPGGVEVTEGPLQHAQAIDSTNSFIADESVPAVFEAAFVHDDVKVRADIIVRLDEAWDVYEVKSGTSVKEVNEWDAALQLYVMEGAGLRVRRIGILHLDREYLYEGGEYDLDGLFASTDVTSRARELRAEVVRVLAEMRGPLREWEPPVVECGAHCASPYDCSFEDVCRSSLPPHQLSELPNVSARLMASLTEAGYATIPEIPEDFPGLSRLQRRVCRVVASGEAHLSPDVAEAIRAQVAFPVHFLDFETIAPALPLYPGTHPYQVLPFQFSDHVLLPDGSVEHHEYLHGPGDPRRPLAEALLRAVGSEGSIVAYSAFEKTRIRALAEQLPDMAASLLPVADRIVDLLPIVRDHCYHPEFRGSFSIKRVLPALVPGMSYEDLEIADGSVASVLQLRRVHPETSAEESAAIAESLLRYCERDTLAMLQLYRALLAARAE